MRWMSGLIFLLSGCLTVPLAADHPGSSDFAAAPGVGTEVTVVPLRVGHKSAPRCVPAGQASCWGSVEIVHVAYLVKHPKATFLIDSGLSSRVKEDLDRFPFFQRVTFDYTPEGSLKEALAAAGSPRLDFVLITHAHWDHTSGLVDLPHPRVILGPGEAEYVRSCPRDKPAAVIPQHLDGAAVETFAWDGPAYENFPSSHDWFGDGSVVLVPLPGHTPGSIGVFVSTVRGRRLLFVGDAAWGMEAIELPSHKLKPMSDVVDQDRDHLSETLWRLHHLHAREPGLLIIPAHDGRAAEAVKALLGAPPIPATPERPDSATSNLTPGGSDRRPPAPPEKT